MGTVTALRESDGIHVSIAGEDVIATYMPRKFAATYHARLARTTRAVVTSWGCTHPDALSVRCRDCPR